MEPLAFLVGFLVFAITGEMLWIALGVGGAIAVAAFLPKVPALDALTGNFWVQAAYGVLMLGLFGYGMGKYWARVMVAARRRR